MLFFDRSKLGVFSQPPVIIDNLSTAEEYDTKLSRSASDKGAKSNNGFLLSLRLEPAIKDVSICSNWQDRIGKLHTKHIFSHSAHELKKAPMTDGRITVRAWKGMILS